MGQVVWRQYHIDRPAMTRRARCWRRVGVLVATVLVAVALGHVFLIRVVDDDAAGRARSAGTPRYLVDDVPARRPRRDAGRRCPQTGPLGTRRAAVRVLHGPGDGRATCCASACRSTSRCCSAALLRRHRGRRRGRSLLRHPPGLRGARACCTSLTAFQLSAPVFFQALLVLFYFSSNVSDFVRLPFLSGQGDYVAAPARTRSQFREARCGSRGCWPRLPLAAFVAAA